jgi:hypothetical protein
MNEPDVLVRTLSLARAALSPPAAEKARVRSALGPAPWRSAALTGTSGAKRAGVPLGTRALSLVSAAIVAALGASFTAGYRLGRDNAAGPPPALPAARAPVTAASEILEPPPPRDRPYAGEPAVAEVTAPRTAHRPKRQHAEARAAGPASPGQPPADELALLRRVERALRSGEPALALALLAELDERFPHSALGEERSASNTMAHCQLHNPGSAERAATFLREHGASVYADPVRSTCGMLAGSER